VDDLAEAARIVRGKKVAEGVEFYIAAASSEVQQESKKRGDWQTLISACAIPLPPGCGPCIGLGTGLLQDGEVGISATNRNFRGRMGSNKADTYLASPAVVAASALAGKITYPAAGKSRRKVSKIKGKLIVTRSRNKVTSAVQIISGFPETIKGELLFCYHDNMNTDGIYPGKYTYLDDFSPQQQAQVVMENYDPEFRTMVKNGDVLAGGFNFGTGSSREQAATALKYCGLQLVIAGSFNETYKRNALNNGFLVIEAPELIRDLKKEFGETILTVRTGAQVTINFQLSEISTGDHSYRIDPVGTAAQELIVSAGLENWVKGQLFPD